MNEALKLGIQEQSSRSSAPVRSHGRLRVKPVHDCLSNGYRHRPSGAATRTGAAAPAARSAYPVQAVVLKASLDKPAKGRPSLRNLRAPGPTGGARRRRACAI